MEVEANAEILFLDVVTSRKPDGSLGQRAVSYTHLLSHEIPLFLDFNIYSNCVCRHNIFNNVFLQSTSVVCNYSFIPNSAVHA